MSKKIVKIINVCRRTRTHLKVIFHKKVEAENDPEHTQAETNRKAFSFSSAR